MPAFDLSLIATPPPAAAVPTVFTTQLSQESAQDNEVTLEFYNGIAKRSLQSDMNPRIVENKLQLTVNGVYEGVQQQKTFTIDLVTNKLPKGQTLNKNQIGFKYLGASQRKKTYEFKWTLYGGGNSQTVTFANGPKFLKAKWNFISKVSSLSSEDVIQISDLEPNAYYGITDESALVK